MQTNNKLSAAIDFTCNVTFLNDTNLLSKLKNFIFKLCLFYKVKNVNLRGI